MTPGQAAFRLAFEISPIYFEGGVAGGVPGAILPLMSVTQGGIFTSIIAGGGDLSLDNFFAHFVPQPNSSLVANVVGEYPFANNQVAGNAIVAQPTGISLVMICPARQPGDYLLKQAIFTALKQMIDQHTSLGGTYSVNTPAYLWTGCVLLNLTDVSGGDSKQVEYRWRWDFRRPLTSLAQANAAQNNLMSALSTGAQTQPNPTTGAIDWSSLNMASTTSSGAILPASTSSSALGSTPTGTVTTDITSITPGAGTVPLSENPSNAEVAIMNPF